MRPLASCREAQLSPREASWCTRLTPPPQVGSWRLRPPTRGTSQRCPQDTATRQMSRGGGCPDRLQGPRAEGPADAGARVGALHAPAFQHRGASQQGLESSLPGLGLHQRLQRLVRVQAAHRRPRQLEGQVRGEREAFRIQSCRPCGHYKHGTCHPASHCLRVTKDPARQNLPCHRHGTPQVAPARAKRTEEQQQSPRFRASRGWRKPELPRRTDREGGATGGLTNHGLRPSLALLHFYKQSFTGTRRAHACPCRLLSGGGGSNWL